MSSQHEALESLRVIRSLMERAHVYRAISAPAALVGGILSLIAGMAAGIPNPGVAPSRPLAFLGTWLAILAVTSALNFALLFREAARRGQPLLSDGMRMARRAIVPPMAVGGVLGIGQILYFEDTAMAATLWILCYGLALLATGGFSPRGLVRLGWSFVATGTALFLLLALRGEVYAFLRHDRASSLAMAATFGLLHVVYAGAVFLGKKPAKLPLP